VAGFLVDLQPLKRYRELRLLSAAQLVLYLSGQLTQTAVPFQVFLLSGHSTVQVGLLSLAQLVPSLIGTAIGGMLADTRDRRNLIVFAQLVTTFAYGGLLAIALVHVSSVWPLYVVMVASSGVSGLSGPAQFAIASSIVSAEDIPSTSALLLLNINLMLVAGPALAGLVIARLGFAPTYDITIACSALGLLMILLMRPVPPASSGGPAVSLQAMADGFTYLRKERVLFASFAIDFEAMIFGMPRVAFPALATGFFHGGAGTYGLLAAAPAAGAIMAGFASGWTANVRRPGLGIIVCVFIWGGAIALVGVVPVLAVAIVMLALAGGADLVSGIYRNTVLQTTVPDEMRGRMTAVLLGMANGGNRVGDAETGAAAAIGGARFAVWSGGLACIVGALWFVARVPALLRYDQRQALAARVAVAAAVEAY
jgi:Transmembrane secretion effector